MKDNVDLTLDRVFSRRIPKLITSVEINGKYPWDYSNKYDKFYNHQSIILLGGKEERKFQTEYRKIEDINYCDCCGARMNIIPWKREVGVCFKCHENYEKDDLNKKQKCPWRNTMRISFALDELRTTQTRLALLDR